MPNHDVSRFDVAKKTSLRWALCKPPLIENIDFENAFFKKILIFARIKPNTELYDMEAEIIID